LGDVQLRNVGMPIPSSKQILSGEGFRLRRARKYSMARRRFSAHQNRPTSARQNGPTCAIGISVCGEGFKVARGRGWASTYSRSIPRSSFSRPSSHLSDVLRVPKDSWASRQLQIGGRWTSDLQLEFCGVTAGPFSCRGKWKAAPLSHPFVCASHLAPSG
jgi:hypothetical protein